MVSDPQLELRVSRLENDRDSLYELISEISTVQREHSQRFDGVAQRFDVIDHQLGTIDATLIEVKATLTEVTTTLTEVTTTMTGFTATMSEVLRRLPEPS